MIINKFVVVNDSITASLFGCTEHTFKHLIKGKRLQVQAEDADHYIVMDDDFTIWYVPKDAAAVAQTKPGPSLVPQSV